MRRARWLLLAIVALSCDRYDPNRYVVAPTDIEAVNRILNLTAMPTSIAADGISSTIITATIHPDAQKRQVTFTSTDGTFTVGAQTDTKRAIVTADLSGVAKTELRTTTTVGVVRVDAAIEIDTSNSIRRAIDVQFTPPVVDDVFTLTAPVTTLPADGFSRAAIIATLKLTGGTPTQRQIVFRSTDGDLIAAGKTPQTSQTVDVAGDGTARVELQSTKNVREVQVTASVAGTSRVVIVRQIAVDPSSIISLDADDTAPADGATQTRVTARVSPALPAGRRDVTFSVSPTSVSLSPASMVADSGNLAYTDLTSPTAIGEARIKATVDGTSAQATVRFVRALPDRILLSAANVTVAPGASIEITATLQRSPGFVTPGTNVIFTATNGSGGPVGSFAGNSVSDAQGQAEGTFFPGTGVTGPVIITATAEGAPAVGTIRIVVQ